MPSTAEQSFAFTWNGVDIATGNLDEMVRFYSDVFDVEFTEIIHSGWKIYRGELGGQTFLLAPDEPSGIEKGQAGVHQFHLKVSNLEAFVTKARGLGHEIEEFDNGAAGVMYYLRDPDGHPWMFASA